MSIHFLSRGPAEQISGGYLYNNYLMAHLRRAGLDVVYHPDPPNLREVDTADIVIVDSLVIGETATRLLPISAKLLLLLHVVPNCCELGRDGPRILAALCRRARVVVTGDNTLPLLRGVLAASDLDAVKIEPGVPQHWCTKNRYAATARTLLGLANYVRGKGIERALDVLLRLRDLPWTLTVYGNPISIPRTSRPLRKDQKCGLGDRIDLRGAVPHDAVNDRMLESDLLVHFSEHESYSTVTAEAIACGLPVFSHRTGNADAFGRSGLVSYFDGDDTAAAAALRSLICDERAYSDLRRTGPGDRRTWQDVGREFVALLGHE
jgi:glycosyltransferase involved in cell wall biosynthesis